MMPSPQPKKHPGVSPAWANLPRRKCDDCGKTYKPKRPLLEGERGFCSANCRKSYHKHGGAYRKLKVEMLKLVASKMKELHAHLRELVREEMDRRALNAFEVNTPNAQRANR